MNFKPLLSILIFLFFTQATMAQLPSARDISSKLGVGWNMGNTLEAIGGETAWGGAKTTQALIDSVKSAGFNTVRLPVAWFSHSDTITSIIDEAWMARVKEVVDYCINADLYVIINMHWDLGWLENRVNASNESIINYRLFEYWTQIAETFTDYDEHLLFAGANEPNVEDAGQMAILSTFHQTFVDAVRATGGNNSSRCLIIQGPSTDIDKTNRMFNTMPEDIIEDRLMVEVHYYTPYQFCLMQNDANWGKVFYYWGKDFHSSTETNRNANWGEEAEMERLFGLMKTKFIDKGIPVILGEFGAYKRDLPASSDQELHEASVDYFNKYVVKTGLSMGIIPYYWDTNMGLFNRSKGTVIDKSLLAAMMEGAAESGVNTFVSQIKQQFSYYPSPFNKEFTLTIEEPAVIKNIDIFNETGKRIQQFGPQEITNTNQLGANLPKGIYLIHLNGNNWHQSFRIVKIEP